MNDATAAALNEIAALLRRRVEQTDEAVIRGEAYHKESEKRMAEISSGPDLSRIREDSDKRMDEMQKMAAERMKAAEQKAIEQQADKERIEAETRAFHERLLVELTRHNDLLARIAAQLEK